MREASRPARRSPRRGLRAASHAARRCVSRRRALRARLSRGTEGPRRVLDPRLDEERRARGQTRRPREGDRGRTARVEDERHDGLWRRDEHAALERQLRSRETRIPEDRGARHTCRHRKHVRRGRARHAVGPRLRRDTAGIRQRVGGDGEARRVAECTGSSESRIPPRGPMPLSTRRSRRPPTAADEARRQPGAVSSSQPIRTSRGPSKPSPAARATSISAKPRPNS